MPMIGGGDGDGVDILIFEELANIDVGFGFRQTHLLDAGKALVQDVFVDIAESGKLDARDVRETADVVVAAAAHATDSHADAIVGAENSAAECKRGCACSDCFSSRFQKFTPFDCRSCHL